MIIDAMTDINIQKFFYLLLPKFLMIDNRPYYDRYKLPILPTDCYIVCTGVSYRFQTVFDYFAEMPYV